VVNGDVTYERVACVVTLEIIGVLIRRARSARISPRSSTRSRC
jgi:hypothetical protein